MLPTELAVSQRSYAELEVENEQLKKELEAERANRANIQGKLDAEIIRTTELNQECEQLRRDDYHLHRLQRRLQEKLRGREEDRRKVEELEVAIKELNSIHQERGGALQACQEANEARNGELEDSKQENAHLKGELGRLRKSLVGHKEKAESARADLERFSYEQHRIHTVLRDQRNRARVERDILVVKLESCKRGREAVRAELQDERTASAQIRRQLAECREALNDIEFRYQSEHSRWMNEKKTLQAIARDQEATILSLQGAHPSVSSPTPSASRSRPTLSPPPRRDAADSSNTAGRDLKSSRANHLGPKVSLKPVPNTRQASSESNHDISLGKRKRITSRSSSDADEQHVSSNLIDSNEGVTEDTSQDRRTPLPPLTSPEMKPEDNTRLRTRRKTLPTQDRRAEPAPSTRRETKR
ncbi:hypothetical protein PQX77_019649 [Marasmius sp. AFHP31]|nr:hypothetical protein PQX77_019649 [Marasmius sp. AFHP31]